jgi:ferritin-like metal-binding protein YciE
MPAKDLNALFLDTLKDIYYAEKQIYKSLPKMAKLQRLSNCAPHSKNTMMKPKNRSSA